MPSDVYYNSLAQRMVTHRASPRLSSFKDHDSHRSTTPHTATPYPTRPGRSAAATPAARRPQRRRLGGHGSVTRRRPGPPQVIWRTRKHIPGYPWLRIKAKHPQVSPCPVCTCYSEKHTTFGHPWTKESICDSRGWLLGQCYSETHKASCPAELSCLGTTQSSGKHVPRAPLCIAQRVCFPPQHIFSQ